LMTTEEKRSRMRLLRNIVKDHNVQRWARSFLQAALPVEAERQLPESGSSGSSSFTTRKQHAGEIPGVALVAASAARTHGSIHYLGSPHSLRRTGTAHGDD